MSYDSTYFYSSVIRPVNSTFLNQLEKAINGEYAAISCYDQIIQMAHNEEARSRVQEIREDEIRHYNTFQHLYHTLTGNPLEPSLSKNCPSQYLDALTFAFHDEQNTVDFYNNLAFSTSDETIKEAFGRAARDEQSHAVWFLYFLNQKGY